VSKKARPLVFPSPFPDAAVASRSTAGAARRARRQIERLRAGATLNLFAAPAALPADGVAAEGATAADTRRGAQGPADTGARAAPRARRAARAAACARMATRAARPQGRPGRRRPPAPRP
jgi:hypothetical protein